MFVWSACLLMRFGQCGQVSRCTLLLINAGGELSPARLPAHLPTHLCPPARPSTSHLYACLPGQTNWLFTFMCSA